MIRERNQAFKISFILLDLFVSALSFSLSIFIHFFVIETEKKVVPDKGGIFAPGLAFGDGETAVIIGTYFYLGLFIVLMQIVVFIAIDMYHHRRGLNFLREFVVLQRGILINLLIVLAFLFFYRGTSFSRMVITLNTLFSMLLIPAAHFLFRKAMRKLSKKGIGTKGVLIIGSGKNAAKLAEILNRHSIYGYRVLGIIGPAKGADLSLKNLIVGDYKDLPDVAEKINPDLAIYAGAHDSKKMSEVISFCDTEGIDCRIVPDFLDIITHRARIEDMDGLPILTIRDIPLRNGYNLFVKRVFDITFSLSVIILLSPLYLLLALLIKMSSPGPVFFTQERVGLDRKHYRVLKFRTMRQQKKEESDTIWGTKNDTRVTGIGSFLRKTSLDEIPQFINVLLGDMSIVGPRPERPHFVSKFKGEYEEYMRRHSVKSGITGWAQINGFRGDTSIKKRVELDIYYIENWSLWFDLAIIIKTIPSMIKNPGE